MKVKFYCDYCGKEFDSKQEAEKCESVHISEQQKARLKDEEIKKFTEEVNKKMISVMDSMNALRKVASDSYISIDYDGGTAKVVRGEVLPYWNSLFSSLFNL